MNAAAPERVLMIVDPQGGGVADFAHCLARAMGSGVRVVPFTPGLQVEPGEAVLLHYSGYGYTRYGAPVRLLAWVMQNRRRMRRLGVFFHEIYATGRPTSSAFWFSPLQRWIAARLTKTCDFWVSNVDRRAAWLQPRAGHKPHTNLPVFSNVGELAVRPLNKKPFAVVFGSASVRAGTYRKAGDALFRWVSAQGLALHDIGSPVADPAIAAALEQAGAVVHGRMSDEAIHALMEAAAFGVVAYGSAYAAKSGIFASYCAHGMTPVLLSETGDEADGLCAGTHYLLGIPAAGPSPAEAVQVAQAAFDWYQGHRIAIHAQTLGDMLSSPGPSGVHGAERAGSVHGLAPRDTRPE